MVKCALPSISEGEGGWEVWRLHRDMSPQVSVNEIYCAVMQSYSVLVLQ